MTIDELSETIGYLRSEISGNKQDLTVVIEKLDSIDKRLQSVEKGLYYEEQSRVHNNNVTRNYILFFSPVVGAISGAIAGFIVSLLR